MSPSLWVNNNNFFQAENVFYKRSSTKKTGLRLYHSWSSNELLNKVRSSSRRMRNILHKRNYPGLDYLNTEFQGKGHNGTVPVSIEYVLKNLEL